jgi:hypothetical protein
MPLDTPPWLRPQSWRRDSDLACVSLGPSGAFDDTHIFAPCVALEDGVFSLYYSGSRGAVADRVFCMGLATSTDGVRFQRQAGPPVLALPGGTRSVLTPTLLRNPDGSVCREEGELRLWFSSCDFPSGSSRHTLHSSRSVDGVAWETPSAELLEGTYAPTVIKEGAVYRMWYSDVTRDPWCIRYAESADGVDWSPKDGPVLQLDQAWEHSRLFYPTVLKADGQYLMWYGSYSQHGTEEMKTAIGFAVSPDGVTWQKHPVNPVFGPDPSRDWESHYTTSQSVLRLPDGSWRIWYASRTKPPFVHKYFAIGTAIWQGARRPGPTDAPEIL